MVYNDSDRLDKLMVKIKAEEGVKLEAYKPDPSEENYTIGIGHYSPDFKKGDTITEEEANELFKNDLQPRIRTIHDKIGNFKNLNPETQDNIVSSWFRGGISGSPNTIRLINEGKFKEASGEFLNNNEYRRRSKRGESIDKAVVARMNRLAEALGNETGDYNPTDQQEVIAFTDVNKFINDMMTAPDASTDYVSSTDSIDDDTALDNTEDSKFDFSIEQKLFLISKLEAGSRGLSQEIDTILNSDLDIINPVGIDENTPILASTDYSEYVSRESDIASEVAQETESIDEGFEYPSGTKSDLGGSEYQAPNTLTEDIEEFTFEGMGDDLINKFTDRNAIGFITQAAIKYGTKDNKIEPAFDVEKGLGKELYTELTSGLDSEDIVDLLDNTNSQGDFIKYASLLQGRKKRKVEMEEYSRKHPVFSGTNTVGNLLTEGAIFMPVSTAIGSAVAATRIKKLSDIAKLRFGAHFIGEMAEQGIQEVIWAANDKEYQFDPILFAGALGVGVGLKQALGSTEADTMIRNLLADESGFINIATDEGKKLVDEVAKNVTDHKAIALAKNITKKKIKAANDIRSNLVSRRSSLTRQLQKVNNKIKANKNPELVKKFKGQKQKVARQLEKFDKNLPNEMRMLFKGDHPKLAASVNPEFKISAIAKDLGIDNDIINSPKKLRKFLGLDQPQSSKGFIIEGEKSYVNIANQQLEEMSANKRFNMNETIKYIAGSDLVSKVDDLPILGKLQISDKLNQLAATDGPMSRFLLNKGNLVSSENELVSSFYNWMAPDGMGRQGMSKIRAIESQQKYSNIYGGELMNLYHAHGSTIYDAVNGKSSRAKGFFSPDDYENTVEPILKERLLSKDTTAFKAKYGETISKAADDFYSDFNKLNKGIVDRAKELKVEGVNFDAEDGWFHRSWDFRKARSVSQEELEDTLFRATKSHVKTLGIEELDDAVLLKNAKKFSYGLRNADLSSIEGLQSDHIKLLEKLLNKADGSEAKLLKDEVSRLKMLKAKADAGDLANRVQMDVNTLLPDGRPLSDLFEDNVIHTQKRYTARMAARIAAAEHGIRNLDSLDDWVGDAVELEIKRLVAKGVSNPKSKTDFIEKSMRQDLMSFKHGGMVGLHDLPDDSASDMIRLVKKYNYARLMQYTGISSIAELGGTFVEAGVSTTLNEMGRYLRNHFNDLYMDNPDKYVGRLYDELRTVTGVGMEDFSFSTKGMSKATRVFETGALNKLEQGVDVLGRAAQAPFGGIEKVGRRMTVNALAIKWGNHFKGTESGGILSAFFGSNGVTNRVLENSGFGKIDELNKFVPNDNYNSIKKSINKFATFDDSGRLTKLNLEKWDTNTAHSFGDAIQMQANHIMVSPDPTTMALWQSTTIGQILNQFRTFTINATTKVMGASLSNAAVSAQRGDTAEAVKAAQKIFWGTSLGVLSVSLRQGIQRAGGDREVDLFDDGLMKAAAIGFSRSSIAGNLPTIGDTISGSFGYDPIFEKASSVGRSKNFFNLTTTPTGQAVGGLVQSGEKALQGDFKGSGMQLMKTSPVYRQIGVQQIFNFVDDEK